MPRQLKFMIVGDSGVGKTSIINTFQNNDYSNINKPEPTSSVDIFFKKFKIKDNSVLINVIFLL